MSDSGYDNVELNELISDLKNVGHISRVPDTETKITFQYSSANRNCQVNSDGYKTENDNARRFPTCQPRVTNQMPTKTSENIHTDKRKQISQVNLNQLDVDNLQKELLIVKKELAILKRSHSLAGHPIFGKNVSENFGLNENYRNELKMDSSLCQNSNTDYMSNNFMNTTTPRILRNTYSSSSNISYQSPRTSDFHYQSLNRLNSQDYSAHRENMEKMKQTTMNSNQTKSMQRSYSNYCDEIEDCSLQPIGKGIRTLNESFTNLNKRDPYAFKETLENNNSTESSYFDLGKTVRSKKDFWLKLDATREECKMILSDQEVGSFMIRIQSDCKTHLSRGMVFELILKVSSHPYNNAYGDNFEYFSIKEFTEKYSKGFKMIGHAIEPIFPNLESFVIRHMEISLGLPCLLKLPRSYYYESNCRTSKNSIKPKLSLPFNIISKKLSGSLTSLSSMKSQMTVVTYAQPTQEILNAELLFLGKIRVDRLYGLNAIRHAVDKALINGCQPKHSIEVNVNFDSLGGISIIDNERILFFKKVLSVGCIQYCGVDPLHRGLNSDYLNSKGLKNSKIFGILYQKRKILLKENKVIVLAELNPMTPMEKILNFVKANLIKQNIF